MARHESETRAMRSTAAAAVGLLLASLAAADAPEPGCEEQATSPPIALERSMSFPPLPARFNVEGHVQLDATIAADGRVSSTKVVAAEPPGTFDATARREVEKWRYCKHPDGESGAPRSVGLMLRFNLEEKRVLPIPESCEPGEAWALVKFDLEEDGTVTNAAIEQACPPGKHDQAVLEEARSLKYFPDVPQPVRGARELYAIEGKILEMPNISRLSFF
jgi:TonB family protein